MSYLSDEQTPKEFKFEIDKEYSSDAEAWATYLEGRPLTLIDELFTGMQKQITQCAKCHHVSTIYDTYTDLMLPATGVKDINEAIDAYLKDEILEKEELHKCSSCEESSQA